MMHDHDLDSEDLFGCQAPPGKYLAGFVLATKRLNRFGKGQDCWDCEFQIIEVTDAGEGAEKWIGHLVPRFLRVPLKTKRRSLRSNFAQDWTQAVGQRPPRDLYRRHPEEMFHGCTLEVYIDSAKKNYKGDLVPEGARYSKIDRVIRRVDGTPLHLQRKIQRKNK